MRRCARRPLTTALAKTLGLLLVSVAWTTAAPARGMAQAGAEASDRADALVREGVALREEGDDEAALARFEEAFRLSPEPRILAQRGLAEQALGRWPDAHEHLSAALEARDDAFVDRYRGVLEEALARVRERVGRLELSGGVPGARVAVNGQPAGTLPLPRPLVVSPGDVVVDVEAQGYLPLRRIVVVTLGGLAREELVLVSRRGPETGSDDGADPAPNAVSGEGAAAATAATRGAGEGGEGSSRAEGGLLRALAWTSAGLALAAGGGAVGALVVREGAVSDARDDACLEGGRTRGENCGDDFDRAENAETAGIVLVSAAGAFAVASAVLFVLSAGRANDGADGRNDGEREAGLRCGGGPGHLGVGCVLAF